MMRAAVPILYLSLLLALLFRPSCNMVITSDLSPGFPPLSAPAPAPTSGGDLLVPSPSHSWGWKSRTSPSSPSPAPEISPLIPREGTPSAPSPSGSPPAGNGIPFISSNPAVPLPTGETDSATFQPLPTPGAGNQVVGRGSSVLPIQMTLWASLVMVVSALGLLI